jgi:hypothetical protein
VPRIKKTGCETAIANWESDSVGGWDLMDWLHTHFAKREPSMRNFLGAIDEARRVWKIAFDEDIEADSPIDMIFHAAVTSSFELTCRDIAERLGVKAEDIKSVFEDDQEHWLPEFVEIANKYKKRKAVRCEADSTS